jgi:hypothetical protein
LDKSHPHCHWYVYAAIRQEAICFQAGILDIEKRKKSRSITSKSLKEIARAVDMQLLYGFVPNDGSLDALIEKRAAELATQIVFRTSNARKLEDNHRKLLVQSTN